MYFVLHVYDMILKMLTYIKSNMTINDYSQGFSILQETCVMTSWRRNRETPEKFSSFSAAYIIQSFAQCSSLPVVCFLG